MGKTSLEKSILGLAQKAKVASLKLALIPTAEKNKALLKMAKALRAHTNYLIRENHKDLVEAQKHHYANSLIDRLTIDQKRIDSMARSLFDTAQLKDPVGEILRVIKRPNGLVIKKIRTPLGVIGVIYESRPNVTSDCVGLAIKSGNSIILKGGKEAFYSNKAIYSVLRNALAATKIPADCVQIVDSSNRQAVHALLKLDQHVDLIIPRGGESLIRFVAQHSLIPVVKHYKGVCHTYVSAKADLKMAEDVCFNAKVQRPGVCNAMETMLVHKAVAAKFLPVMCRKFKDAGVELRGCERTRRLVPFAIKRATEKDWYEEYLDLILAVKVVDSVYQAIDHINTYGTKHSDAIITKDKKEAAKFLAGVDAASLYVNASTRFTDGYEFGFGAEVGISTDKLHARGPMALEELTTYKYLVYGKGQIRQ